MKSRAIKYIISLFFAGLLLFKGVVFVTMIVSLPFDKIDMTELLMESDQEEKKGGSKAETNADELFENAVLPPDDIFCNSIVTSEIFNDNESLANVYLDMVTPPPNYLSC
jgi:hypothetical protein